MKSSELRGLSHDDLQQQLKDGRTELFNLRFQQATSQLDNTARINIVKKDIARVLTEIRSRELNVTVEQTSQV
jgi:large subunit ribosomal protein L29